MKQQSGCVNHSVYSKWQRRVGFAPAVIGSVTVFFVACQPIGTGALGERCRSDLDCDDGLICPADGLAHVTAFCTATALRQTLPGVRQWASDAEATSFLAIDTEAAEGALYSPDRLSGPPDAPLCSFSGNCWTAERPRAGIQVLDLHYDDPVFATAVEIVEHQNPGTVIKVELIEEQTGAATVVWEGEDETRACPGFLGVRFDKTDFATRAVRVHLDTDLRRKNAPFATDHVLIDAVALIGETP